MASPNPPPKSPATSKSSSEAASSAASEDQELASLTLKEAEERSAAILSEAERRAQEILEEAAERMKAADEEAKMHLAEVKRLRDELFQSAASPSSESRRAPARIVEPIQEGTTRIRPLRSERASIAGVPYNFEIGVPLVVPSEIVPHLIRVGIVAEGPEYASR